MTVRVIQGDCLEVMPTLDAESIDAIVCDPPYGLSFMGKHWDHGVPGVDFWIEAIRVAKPGAYLLAFGGDRTHHRLMCAIEDAGWEIRTSIAWIFGSGFPKSLNVSKALGGSLPADVQCACVLDSTRIVQGSQSDYQSCRGSDDGQPLDGSAGGLDVSPSPADALERSRGDQLLDGQAEVAASICLDGGIARPSNDCSPGHFSHPSEDCRSTDSRSSDTSASTLRASQMELHKTGRHTPGKSGWGVGSASALALRYPNIPQCDTCGKLRVPKGLGTALKPAFEIIILARKPFKQTVAANVQEHGTGALNIDACRISVDASDPNHRPGITETTAARSSLFGIASQRRGSIGEGRWPANVCLDEIAAARLDEMSGDTRSNVHMRGVGLTAVDGKVYGKGDPAFATFRGHNDSGGASRFFYTAKAGRSEREEGLEAFAHRPRADVMSMNSHDHEGGIDGRGQPYKIAPVKNNHPTVKPLDLMRWLVRLVTPPNGVVLDPFMGSGTTGIAAVLESKRFIGIEKEQEYCAIAEKRIAHWGAQGILNLDGVA